MRKINLLLANEKTKAVESTSISAPQQAGFIEVEREREIAEPEKAHKR